MRRVRAWLLDWVRTLLLLRRLLGRLLLLLLRGWTRLLLRMLALLLLLQLMWLLTLANEHLTHTLTPRLRLLLHQLKPLSLLTSHMWRARLHHLHQLLASSSSSLANHDKALLGTRSTWRHLDETVCWDCRSRHPALVLSLGGGLLLLLLLLASSMELLLLRSRSLNLFSVSKIVILSGTHIAYSSGTCSG